MMIAWAHADEALIGAIARILGSNVNMVQAGYYRLPTFESRVKFARALLSEWQSSGFDKQAIDREIGKLGGLASTRNHWVHGHWCFDDGTSEVVVFDHRSGESSSGRRKFQSCVGENRSP
jgi:hypothetical protein